MRELNECVLRVRQTKIVVDTKDDVHKNNFLTLWEDEGTLMSCGDQLKIQKARNMLMCRTKTNLWWFKFVQVKVDFASLFPSFTPKVFPPFPPCSNHLTQSSRHSDLSVLTLRSCHWGRGPIPHWWLCIWVSVHITHLHDTERAVRGLMQVKADYKAITVSLLLQTWGTSNNITTHFIEYCCYNVFYNLVTWFDMFSFNLN